MMSFLFVSLLTSCFADMTLHYLTPSAEYGGYCLDGTTAGYYLELSNTSTNSWLIFIQGGGACFSNATCYARANSDIGTSSNWQATMEGKDGTVTDCNRNPYFCKFNHVYIPYCTQDTHTGRRNTPSAETWGFYFDGHNNLALILQDLVKIHGLQGDGIQLMVTGSSAGAIGVYSNIDYILDYLLMHNLTNLTIKAAPQAGWFFPGNASTAYVEEPWWAPPSDYSSWQNNQVGGLGHTNYTVELYNSYLMPSCKQAHPDTTWWCSSVHVMYKYIKTELFVMQNVYDYQQLEVEMFMPACVDSTTEKYVEYWGESVYTSLKQVLYNTKKNDGLFLASCYLHAEGFSFDKNFSTTKINNYAAYTFLFDWFIGNYTTPTRIYDDCILTDNLPCNPTCAGFDTNTRSECSTATTEGPVTTIIPINTQNKTNSDDASYFGLSLSIVFSTTLLVVLFY